MNTYYLKELEIDSFKNFTGNNIISFTKKDGSLFQWTIFLGINGTGKTNILKALSLLNSDSFGKFPNDEKTIYVPLGFTKSLSKVPFKVMSHVGVFESFGSSIEDFSDQEEIDDFHWGFTEHSGSSNDIYDLEKNLKLYGYGVTRRASTTSSLSTKDKEGNFKTLFNPDEKLINLNEWLLQTDYAAKNGQSDAKKRLKLIKEVITGEIFPEIINYKFITNKDLNNFVEFQTSEGSFKYDELAYGYQSTLSWIIDLCKNMFDQYPTSKNPLKEPGIVLIDELDLHLHPGWQRNIVKILSDLFPKIQFIVTTHSPLIIQSLSNANVYILNKTHEGVMIDKLPTKSYTGWSVEEILNKVMGLGSKVKSDEYLDLVELFDKSLDEQNFDEAKSAYDKLMMILPENDFQRKMFSMQYNSFIKIK